MFKKILSALIGIVIVVGAIVYTKIGQFTAMGEAAASMKPPPETITVATADPMQWERSVSATGSLAAVRGVTVAAEVAGRVVEIAFESGARVEAGDVLVRLDSAAEEAQLAAARAAAELARATLQRRTELAKRNLVSTADVDTARAQSREAAAQIDVVRAAIESKTIKAPFAGRLGLRRVDLGQIVRAGDPIVTLQTLDPIHVEFTVPQHRLPQITVGMPVRVSTDATPGRHYEGTINAVSPEVDPATRTVRVQALIANARQSLFPGMFARVEAILPQAQPVLAIPTTAVSYAPYGNSVFVVESKAVDGQEQLSLRQQFVRLGEARGDFVDVIDGLRPGDRVASSGVFKLRSGMPVVIDNTLAPQPSLDPKPANS